MTQEPTKPEKQPDAIIGSIKIADARKFKSSFVTSITSLLEEANLRVGKDGITICQMDPSGISMIILNFPKSASEKWNVSKAGNIGISVQMLKAAFDKVKKGEALEISTGTAKEGESGRPGAAVLRLKFTGKGVERKAVIPYIGLGDRETKEHKLPQIKFTGSFDIDAKQLKDILSQAKKAGQMYLDIEVSKGKVEFSGKQETKSNWTIKAPDASGNAKAGFNLEYLQKLLKAADKGSSVHVGMATDEPMLLEYEVFGSKAKMWLAPYMESNGEKKAEKPKPVRIPKEKKVRMRA